MHTLFRCYTALQGGLKSIVCSDPSASKNSPNLLLHNFVSSIYLKEQSFAVKRSNCLILFDFFTDFLCSWNKTSRKILDYIRYMCFYDCVLIGLKQRKERKKKQYYASSSSMQTFSMHVNSKFICSVRLCEK